MRAYINAPGKPKEGIWPAHAMVDFRSPEFVEEHKAWVREELKRFFSELWEDNDLTVTFEDETPYEAYPGVYRFKILTKDGAVWGTTWNEVYAAETARQVEGAGIDMSTGEIIYRFEEIKQ